MKFDIFFFNKTPLDLAIELDDTKIIHYLLAFSDKDDPHIRELITQYSPKVQKVQVVRPSDQNLQKISFTKKSNK